MKSACTSIQIGKLHLQPQPVSNTRLFNGGEIGGDFPGGVSAQRFAGAAEFGKRIRAHALPFDAMRFLGRDKPSAGLFADNAVLAIHQTPNGQPAFISFGNSRHTGIFP